MRGLIVLATVLTVLGAAALLCGCGDRSSSPGQSPPGQQPQVEREYDLDATGRAVAEQLGGHAAAAFAVLKAADNGYAPYQIAAAVDAGLLEQSGIIQGATPAGPAGNILSGHDDITQPAVAAIALNVSVSHIANANDGLMGRSDFEQMFQEIRDEEQAGRWLVWVLGSTGAGYSVRQIAEYLDANRPFTSLVPPTAVGVPVIVDGEQNLVMPESPPDWPYKGRNILAGLQQKQDLDFDDNHTVLVIGMVNAGYSAEQINDAVWTNSIGLCATQGDASGSTRITTGYVKNGEIVPPAQTTPLTPATIVIENVLPVWPLKGTTDLDNVSTLQRGQPVTLKLTPYIASKDTGLKITRHDVVMTIEPAGDSGAYHITCKWKIELVQETDDYKRARGSTYVCEAEAYDPQGNPMSLDRIGRLRSDFTYTAFKPDGELDYTVTQSLVGFSGSLNEVLEGDGMIGSVGPTSLNWDTYPGVLPGGQ